MTLHITHRFTCNFCRTSGHIGGGLPNDWSTVTFYDGPAMHACPNCRLAAERKAAMNGAWISPSAGQPLEAQ